MIVGNKHNQQKTRSKDNEKKKTKTDKIYIPHRKRKQKTTTQPGCRTVSNNGSGSGLAPAQNILAVQVHLSTTFEVQVWFRFTQVKYYWFRFGSGSLT